MSQKEEEREKIEQQEKNEEEEEIIQKKEVRKMEEGELKHNRNRNKRKDKGGRKGGMSFITGSIALFNCCDWSTRQQRACSLGSCPPLQAR